jgi:hypothetical protein
MDMFHAPICIWLPRIVFPSSSGIREQSDMTGAFDSTCQDSLVTGTGSRLTARTDLAIVGNEPSKHIPFFVVDTYCFVSTKLTKFWTGKEAALPGATFISAFV